MRTTKKLGLAAAVALALLIGLAAPAGASHLTTIESGTLTTVLGNFDLTPGSQGTPPCPEKTDTLRFTTNANGTWTLGGVFSGQFQFPPASGNWFQADFTVLPGSGGNWAGAHPTNTLTGVIGIQVRIYQLQLAGGPLNCAKTNLRCIITGAFTLDAVPVPTSTYKSGPLNTTGLPTTKGAPIGTPDNADHVTINATSGALTTSSCSPPWNGVGGTVATITNLQAHMLEP